MKDKGKKLDKNGNILCEWKLPKEKKCRFPFGYCYFWRFCYYEGIKDFPFETDGIRESNLPKEYFVSEENKIRLRKWLRDV